MSDLWHDRALSANGGSPGKREPNHSDWIPPSEITESEEAFHILMDIPGVRSSDVAVEIDGSYLRVAGEKAPKPQSGARRMVSEIMTGRFSRQFKLTDQVDREAITAEHRDGQLEVVVPKTPAAKRRTIPVVAEARSD